MKLANGLLGIILASVLYSPLTRAQSVTNPAQPDSEVVRTFYLTNISQAGELSQLINALRNILTPKTKVYVVDSQSALILSATPDQLALAQKIINDLDRPRKTYRLIYTIVENDGGKRIGVQHFAMVVVSGQRTTVKQGSRVPLVTGSYNPGTSSAQTQVTYVDIGLNFDATLDESNNGVRLRTKVEQSSVAAETSGVGVQDPIVRQTVLEGTSILTPGKPLVLGSLDIPSSTRHLDLEVVTEVVH